MFHQIKIMTTPLESLFGGSLLDLAEKAGTRLNEAEERIQNCEKKSENAIQNVSQLESKLQIITNLLDKMNSRFDMFENDVVASITTRLDKQEEYIQYLKQKYKKETVKEPSKNDCKQESVRESKSDDTQEFVNESKSDYKQEFLTKSDGKQVENVNKHDLKNDQERDRHIKNDLLNKKVRKDKDLEQGKMKALRMLDELSVVSESR